MYSRLVQCTLDRSHVDEFKSVLNTQLLPRIQAQPGFIDNLESLDAATGQFSCMTLWKSASDIENYDKALFQEVATRLGPYMQGAPTVQTLPVENSSAHRVMAGRAAA